METNITNNPASSNTSLSTSSNNGGVTQEWAKNAENQILNLGTSDSDIYDLMVSEFTSGDTSPERQQLLTFLLDKRQQTSALLSNLIRTITDGANSIIRNIRA